MYTIFKNRIESGNYQLFDIQSRIKKLYSLGDLNDEQMDELLQLSQRNATANAERPAILEILRRLEERVAALEGSSQDGSDSTATYEQWMPWDGISDKYQYGAIVYHIGKLWISIFNGKNVWEPGVPGTELMWAEYVEGVSGNA